MLTCTFCEYVLILSHYLSLYLHVYISLFLCVCVCVCERERERERESACVCVFVNIFSFFHNVHVYVCARVCYRFKDIKLIFSVKFD